MSDIKEVEKKIEQLEEQLFEGTQIPLIVHQLAETKHEKREIRLWIAIIIALILLAGSNMAWLYVFQSYDYVTETITVDSADGGNANYIGNDGDINNGESGSSKENQK